MTSNQRTVLFCALITSACIFLAQAPADAAIPSDKLMSPATRGYVSIGDIELLHQRWLQTQMGQLMKDEAMQPFVEDLKRQLQSKVTGVKDKLGLDLSDLKGVAGGEIALGLVEQNGERAAVALTVDVTGKQNQLNKLLRKIDRELSKRKATKSVDDQLGVEITTYRIPEKKDPTVTRTALFFVKDNVLCATDSLSEAGGILSRFEGQTVSLSRSIPYVETMRRCTEEAQGLEPDLRWYFDPFGYARASRSLVPKDKIEHGKDYVNILQEQGFDAIQGIGGYVNLAVGGSYEVLHRTSVFAPPIPGDPEKYRLAMRMMNFPNRDNMVAHKWLPRKLATYRTISCDLDNAFENFDTLFDAIAGYEEAFAGVLEGLERDPYGPQVDVRKDFVAHLGERIMLVTDYELPITPQCERFMIVVELTNEEAIARTVEKFMKSDPNATQSMFEGKVIWEIQEMEEDIPEIDITTDDLDLLDSVEATAQQQAAVMSPTQASAVCVTSGHLFIASHTVFLKEVLSQDESRGRLNNTEDYRQVDRTLSRLLPGNNSIKSFVRMDEAFRPVYELLRQGKMPESETLFGRLLNRLLTPPEEEDEGILRKQKIDGRQLPDFEMVRRYFGPAGTIIRSENDGWFVVGASLSKLSPQARIPMNTTANQSQLR